MAMPIRPPMTDSVVASIRNWARMSRPRAPMALRMPISRVRSRTDTSMMFMIPMPPTTSEMAAMPASSSDSRPEIELKVSRIWAWLEMVKSSVAGSRAVALAQQRRYGSLRGRDLLA